MNSILKNKLFLIPLIALTLSLILASCNKNNDEPTPATSTPVADTGEYHIRFDLSNQDVTLRTSKDTLQMVYKEDVVLLLSQANYTNSWAVHLIENFSQSQLKTFHYSTVNDGYTVIDWVDDNLNDLSTKIVSDTTVENKKMVKIEVKRDFIFTNVYSNAQDAVNEEIQLLNTTTDQLVFSSYVFFVQTYPAYSGSASVVYKSSNQGTRPD
jgi:hypothetical protein